MHTYMYNIMTTTPTPPGMAIGLCAPSACLEEYISHVLAPCSGSLLWNPLTVVMGVCLRRNKQQIATIT